MIRDIAIHLTGSNEDQIRIEHAATLGRALDAHLTGLQVREMPEVLAITDPSGSGYLQELIADSVARAATTSDKLRQLLAATGLNHELRRLDLFQRQIASALASEVRLCDLFVGTRPYGDPNRQQHIEEGVLFESGRPCLFVPPGHRAPDAYSSILVAWKNTREAAVAIGAAIPVMRAAEQVTVAVVEEGGASEERGEAVDEDIGRYLSRHGVNAEIRLIAGWSSTSAAILNEADHFGAQMIVLGAYGHSRVREWALGGVTRDVLSQSPVPVFAAR